MNFHSYSAVYKDELSELFDKCWILFSLGKSRIYPQGPKVPQRMCTALSFQSEDGGRSTHLQSRGLLLKMSNKPERGRRVGECTSSARCIQERQLCILVCSLGHVGPSFFFSSVNPPKTFSIQLTLVSFPLILIASWLAMRNIEGQRCVTQVGGPIAISNCKLCFSALIHVLGLPLIYNETTRVEP